jgi:hypothetical protein
LPQITLDPLQVCDHSLWKQQKKCNSIYSNPYVRYRLRIIQILNKLITCCILHIINI